MMDKLLKLRNYVDNHTKRTPSFRPFDFFVKDQLGNGFLTGVEIGVNCGFHAQSLVNVLNINRLYLVDPYCDYVDKDHVYNYEDAYREAVFRLNSFKDRVVFIKSKSHEAVESIPDGLDFVYIDGNHDYDFVKKDIMLYYDKVRSGGVLGGHDFGIVYHGVAEAVVEFCKDYGYELNGRVGDWWIVKN